MEYPAFTYFNNNLHKFKKKQKQTNNFTLFALTVTRTDHHLQSSLPDVKTAFISVIGTAVSSFYL